MAVWSKNKVESSAINGGNEYEKKDRLSREQLNAITNNSFYASDVADEAKRIAENVEAGTNSPVSYAPQVLLAEQQKQARENIGATSSDDVSGLINSISIMPKYSSFYDVSFGVGTNFVAQSNGYFRLYTQASIENTWWNIAVNNTFICTAFHTYPYITLSALIPVKKGDVVKIEMGNGELVSQSAIFIPSEVVS